MMCSVYGTSEQVTELARRLEKFVREHCIPAEQEYERFLDDQPPGKRWSQEPPVLEKLRDHARSLGLWNLSRPGLMLNVEYALLSEMMGWSPVIAPEACNCNAPDTGNMELLERFGTEEQKQRWLAPLLEGRARSAFAMTEPHVASSDARNIRTKMTRDHEDYIVNGHKYYISGAGHPKLLFYLVLGRMPDGSASILIVPSMTDGIELVSPGRVFGWDDAVDGHWEVRFSQVRVPAENLLGTEGQGWSLIQSRLGAGRIHHCMRAIGMAERALALMKRRLGERRAFGKTLEDNSLWIERVAKSRLDIDMGRLVVLRAAHALDGFHRMPSRDAKKMFIKYNSIVKVWVPEMAARVVDRAIQSFGARGVSQSTPLARFYAQLRALRIADGPDEVHLYQLGLSELRRPKQAEASPLRSSL